MKVTRYLSRLSRAFWLSLAAYACVATWQGRDVLRGLYSGIASDAGDPLLNATVISWSAQHVPWTQAWWNLPTYAPTPDAMTFAEHLLGIAPISTPLYWLTGSGLAAYNLTLLLTFPLCGAAMFLLVHHLTRNGAASFVSGLAYAFAPYRIAHLWHVQILASFWLPLAFLGLHQYLDTGRRSWLLLFGLAWAFQAAANGYYLVFSSVLIGLWILWFVVFSRRWSALWRIAAAAVIASVPLWPIVLRYAAVHTFHGFSRSLDEVMVFSPDIAGVLCASARLQFWGWLQVGCKLEGELFPGLTIPLFSALAVVLLWRSAVALPRMRWLRAAVWIAIAIASIYFAIAISVWWAGRWRLELGPITATASSFKRFFSVALWAAIVAFALTARFGRIAVTATSWFYAAAALATWLLALGPVPMLAGARAFGMAPYSWLMVLPGVDALRVPSRFWMMTVFCLAVLSGLLVSRVLAALGPRIGAVLVALVASGIVLDGWIARIPIDRAPDMLWADRLSGSTVLELPFQHIDTPPGFRAAEGGWRSVNGYSGFDPPSYAVLRAAARAEDGSFLRHLLRSGDASVIVRKDAPRQVDMVQREARSAAIAETDDRLLYVIPQRSPLPRVGRRVAVARVTSSCAADLVHQVVDGRRTTAWDCGPQFREEHLVLDIGQVQNVGAVRQALGRRTVDHPRELVIETSEDHVAWRPAWSGGTAGLVFQAAVEQPLNVSIVVPFEPRPARYVRLRQVAIDPHSHWSVAEIELYESTDAAPRD